MEAPLQELGHAFGLTTSSRITWAAKAEKAFTDLKQVLQTTPTLDLPNPLKLFVRTGDEKHDCMTSLVAA